MGLTGMSLGLWRQAETQKQIAEFRENSANAEALFATRELEALVAAMKLGQELQQHLSSNVPPQIWGGIDPKTQMQAVTVLREILYGTTTRNHLDARGGVNSVNFSPDGQTIIAFSSLDGIRFWDWNGQVLQTLPTGRVGVNTVNFSPDGNILALTRENGTIEFWTLAGEKLQTLTGYGERIHQILFSQLQLWSPNGELRETLNQDRVGVKDFNIGPDGILATVDIEDRVRLWSGDGKSLSSPFDAIDLNMSVDRIGFARNGHLIVVGWDRLTEENAIALWTLDGTRLATLPVGGDDWSPKEVVLSPNGDTLAIPNDNNTVQLWHLNGTELQDGGSLMGHRDRITHISFGIDGRTIATASADSTAKLWNRQGELLGTLIGHGDEVTSVSVSPNGNTIATASRDNTVKLWNREGQLIETLIGHGDEVTHVSFDPDGQTLATVSRDGKAILWNLDLENLLKQGCLWLEDYLATHPEDLAELQICHTDTLLAEASAAWVQQGKTEARNGNFHGAMEAFRKAKIWNRALDLDPEVAAAPATIIEGEELAMEGRIDAAIDRYEKAQALDPTLEISAQSWEDLCWYGSLDDRAEDVLDACDRAVALNPEDGQIRISRGLARGLSGDRSGAIADFQEAIDWMNAQDYEEDIFVRERSRLQSWLESLKAGNNPWTPEKLEQLKNDW